MNVHPEVNTSRLRRDLEGLARFGALPGGGITRYAYHPEDIKSRHWIADLMKSSGLEVRFQPIIDDEIGNVIGVLPGSRPDLPPITAGSHNDTVPVGGMFDGALGIIGALEAARAIAESGTMLQHPLEVISMVNEEGAPGVRVSGSRTYIEAAKQDGRLSHCFLELHIEQGKRLSGNNLALAVVEGVVGGDRYALRIQGETNHAGTTPMDDRNDAMCHAADVILAIRDFALQKGEMVATVGKLQAHPGAVNVIAGSVEMSLDVRSMDTGRIDALYEFLKDTVGRRLQLEVQRMSRRQPVWFNPRIRQVMGQVASSLNIGHTKLVSWAGHDACGFSRVAPTGMIFVSSQGGFSHCPQEFTTWEDAARGVQTLAGTIVELDRLSSEELAERGCDVR